jgi:hypothetical protein
MTSMRRLWLSLFLFPFVALPSFLQGQVTEYLAIIPAFHDRMNTSGSESPLRLQRQRFVLFVYRNAVAVYSEADFVNTGSDTLSQEFALPSTGHDENSHESGGKISNGILNIQCWIEGKRVAPEFVQNANEEWYTVRSRFAPGERRRVKAVFWAQTSLTDVDSLPGLDTVAIAIGKRGFLLDLYHASVWSGAIESVDITMVLKGGMSFQRDAFAVEPRAYELQDSTVTWSLKSIDPSPGDNVVVLYAPAGRWGSATNTMAKLSTYIVKKAYDNLRYYVKQMEQE